MFSALKKRLKEALQRASAIVKEEKEVPERLIEKIPKAEEKSKIKETEKPAVTIEMLTEKEELEAEKLFDKTEESMEKKAKKSLFGGLAQKITEKKLSEEEVEKILKELRTALLENDVALDVAEKLSDEVKHGLTGKNVKRGDVEKIIRESLKMSMLSVLKQEKIDIESMIKDRPLLVIFFGFNGVGKTTSIAKVASRYKKYRPVIAAGDTFRAASIEQLEEHAKNLGISVVKHKYGSDSAAVIFDAVKHASAVGAKLVLADTAGRSHSNVNLMDELKKVVRVNKPDLKILVLDSITGNDIVDQSKLFDDAVGVDAIILTKADVYEKGGAALSASHTIKKPILFLGTGQNYDDLVEFKPEEIVKNLLG